MPKGSPQLTAARREEILSACERLYKSRSFSEIMLRDIADETSFTRTSIYNYFQSKEEIFLALLEREFQLWADSLESILWQEQKLTKTALADRIAKTLEQRSLMLKIYSLNLCDLAENSRDERLVEFNVAYGSSRMVMQELISRFIPGISREERDSIVFTIFTYLHGIWPATYATEKQLLAMKHAGVPFSPRKIYQTAFDGLQRLLSI